VLSDHTVRPRPPLATCPGTDHTAWGIVGRAMNILSVFVSSVSRYAVRRSMGFGHEGGCIAAMILYIVSVVNRRRHESRYWRFLGTSLVGGMLAWLRPNDRTVPSRVSGQLAKTPVAWVCQWYPVLMGWMVCHGSDILLPYRTRGVKIQKASAASLLKRR
jgi:hypothetical protein